jgi:nitronate monooxygenase
MNPAVKQFCERFGLRVPVLLGPMAGACPPSLSIAVAQAGGLGACGALLMQPAAIRDWVAAVREATSGPFQINLWTPDPEPARDAAHESRLRGFLSQWGPSVPPEAADARPPDFAAQFETLLELAPPAVSSVMGLYTPEQVKRLKAKGIAWIANVSTVTEAIEAERAGADVIAAQGSEAGGHRGCFDAAEAEVRQVGTFSLIPSVVDAVRLPVVATGGIADPRGVAAALMLGASAVQVGTGFLRTPEAKIHPAWADALRTTRPEQTRLTRAFSGRAGRSIETEYVRAAATDDAPPPAPYPVQRGLSAAMREAATKAGDVQRMQAWAGQSCAMARDMPAAALVDWLWDGASALLAGAGR